ncbi:hypothetical protein CI238_05451, partial [Colletotrichum incanum]
MSQRVDVETRTNLRLPKARDKRREKGGGGRERGERNKTYERRQTNNSLKRALFFSFFSFSFSSDGKNGAFGAWTFQVGKLSDNKPHLQPCQKKKKKK